MTRLIPSDMKMLHATLLGAAACAVLAATPASAAQTFFGENANPRGTVGGDPVTARNAFAAQLEGTSTEDFDSFASLPTTLSFEGSAGKIGATLGAGATLSRGASGTFPTSGTNLLNLRTAGFTITFDTAVSAIGFFGTDIGESQSVRLALELIRADGVERVIVPHSLGMRNGSLMFFGLIDKENPFTAVRFVNMAGSGDIYGIDDIIIGDPDQVAAVPEPASWAMMIGGFGVLGAHMRRRPAMRRARA